MVGPVAALRGGVVGSPDPVHLGLVGEHSVVGVEGAAADGAGDEAEGLQLRGGVGGVGMLLADVVVWIGVFDEAGWARSAGHGG